jgi:acyl-coenzyme A thioesterase PaaI-like protein
MSSATRQYELGREHYGAFEGVFGGLIAAAALTTARAVADGRRVVSLDCQFMRSLPAGQVTATAEIVRSGRAASSSM